MRNHPLIYEYVSDVSKQVKARELRKEIRAELTCHLEELIALKQDQGWDDDLAAQWAITQMGDADSVADGLNQVHKPRVPWGLLTSLLLLLVIALVTMYAIDLSYRTQSHALSDVGLFLRQAFYITMGIVLLFTLSRFHYRKLLNLSWTLYCITIIILVIPLIWGPQINGSNTYLRLGFVVLDSHGISLYLFIAAAAGLLYKRRDSVTALIGHTVLFTVVPLLLYSLAPSILSMVIYTIAYSIFLTICGRGWRLLILHALTAITPISLSILFSLSGRKRLAAFLNPSDDSLGSGYTYLQIAEALRSAGWWGHGFASVTRKLPHIHSETVFTYIIYSMGWVFGAFVLLSSLLFITQQIKLALSIRDTYGKLLIYGFSSMFTVQFVWSIGMSLGLLPVVGVSLPFISYGGSGLLIHLAASGIIYSVYRRKDMIVSKPTH